MILVILIDKILHDTSALENPNSLAICESVCNRRDPPVGINLKEPWFFLGVL